VLVFPRRPFLFSPLSPARLSFMKSSVAQPVQLLLFSMQPSSRAVLAQPTPPFFPFLYFYSSSSLDNVAGLLSLATCCLCHPASCHTTAPPELSPTKTAASPTPPPRCTTSREPSRATINSSQQNDCSCGLGTIHRRPPYVSPS
jgi:hypothetical protein